MTFQFGKFRKLPVVIEAAQYPGHSAAALDDLEAMKKWLEAIEAFEDWIMPLAKKCGRWPLKYRGQQLIIPTLEGEMAANPGDWIIVGVAGELYPCAREIFAQTYVRAQG